MLPLAAHAYGRNLLTNLASQIDHYTVIRRAARGFARQRWSFSYSGVPSLVRTWEGGILLLTRADRF